MCCVTITIETLDTVIHLPNFGRGKNWNLVEKVPELCEAFKGGDYLVNKKAGGHNFEDEREVFKKSLK